MLNIPDWPNTAVADEFETRTTALSDSGFFALTRNAPTVESTPAANNSHVAPPSREMLTSTLLTEELTDQVMSYFSPLVHCSPAAGKLTVSVADAGGGGGGGGGCDAGMAKAYSARSSDPKKTWSDDAETAPNIGPRLALLHSKAPVEAS